MQEREWTHVAWMIRKLEASLTTAASSSDQRAGCERNFASAGRMGQYGGACPIGELTSSVR